MTARKSNEEKLQELDLKMEQLKKQKQAILKRKQEKERKARTRRLIEKGALAEKYLNCQEIMPLEFEQFLRELVAIPNVADYIRKNKRKEENE